MSSLRSSSRSKTDQDLSLLCRRRPSWASTLSEHEGGRTFGSRSKRHNRLHNDSQHRSLEPSASFPQSRTFVLSLDEATRQPRKPRVETEASPEILKDLPSAPTLPESPEEGKGFRSSWEINVKDLVGDAVGNVGTPDLPRVCAQHNVIDEYKPFVAGYRPCCVSGSILVPSLAHSCP